MSRGFRGAFRLPWSSGFGRRLSSCGFRGRFGARQELLFKDGDAFGLRLAGGLLLAQEQSEFVKLCFECGLTAFAILEARFELAFA